MEERKLDLNEFFIDKGIYKLKSLSTDIFLCEPLQNSGIGKLTRYEHLGEDLYRRTEICYLINSYKEGDIKELFINRDNYEMLGMIGKNYSKERNGRFIKKQ